MDTVSQVKLDCKTVGFSQNRFNFQGLKHQHLRVCKPHMPSLQTFSWLLAHSFFFKFKISWGEVDALSWCFFVFLVQCGVILYINRILVFFHVYHVWLSNFYAIRHQLLPLTLCPAYGVDGKSWTSRFFLHYAFVSPLKCPTLNAPCFLLKCLVCPQKVTKMLDNAYQHRQAL